MLQKMARQANGRWELVKVNTEENQELAATYKIASIPAVKLFVNGEVVDEFVGALHEREIGRFIEKALPPPCAKQLAEARRLLAEGESAQAAQLLESIVNSEPTNFEARVLLAQALLSPHRSGLPWRLNRWARIVSRPRRQMRYGLSLGWLWLHTIRTGWRKPKSETATWRALLLCGLAVLLKRWKHSSRSLNGTTSMTMGEPRRPARRSFNY
jgi:thiol-disulfide isomerase/thioredoxin